VRVALINPRWAFDGSIYFGCREPHLPLELGYCSNLLRAGGHEVLLLDGHLDDLTETGLVEAAADFAPDMTVITTAPTYLFWRCAQPELRVPASLLRALGQDGGLRVVVGPHGSTTPEAALAKLDCDVVVRGECEEVVAVIADGTPIDLVSGIARRDGEAVKVQGGPQAARFVDAAPLRWPEHWVRGHHHHHHRFDREPAGPGAEVEASRGCPYHCSFCAKIDFRDAYRRRQLPLILEEVDALIAQGATYLYFVDEIFLPQRPLLEALVERPVEFGVQTRIDLWKPAMIELLGAAGCVSIEAGVESLTPEGREALDKNCRMSTDELTERLLLARRHVPFVQANLIETPADDDRAVADWRARLRDAGIWANDPVPLFPYPGAPDYRKLWGAPDERAWERAHEHYLRQFRDFSDIQDDAPLPLPELERI